MSERQATDRERSDHPLQAELARAQLDCIPFSTALLDEDGNILAVNEAWRAFGRENDADRATSRGLGLNYFEACLASDERDAVSVVQGIREVLSGRKAQFEFVYAGHSPSQLRWFRLYVRPTPGLSPGGGMAVVAHLDVTESHMAKAHFNIQANVAKAISSRVPMLRACRELALSVCLELAWDYAGIWTVDLPSWTLKCCDTWSRPDLKLSSFERDSRAASLSPGSGLPGRAWRTAKVQWATDLDLDLVVPMTAGPGTKVMPPSALRCGFRTALSFPLKCGDDVLAVVDVFSLVRRPPEKDLMDLLEASGDQLALWELRERAEEYARVAQGQADDARSRLESVLDCAPAFVVVVDREHTIRFINRTMTRVPKEAMIGRSWTDYLRPTDRGRIEAALATVLRTGTIQNYETAADDEAGRARWFLNHMGPIRIGHDITGAVVIAQDITEAKLAQAELLDAQRLASVGTLAAGVAHEINTPVQFVADSLHFLREASGDVIKVLDKLQLVKRASEDAATKSTALSQALKVATAVEESADLDYLRENMPKAFDRAVEGLDRVTTIVRSMKEFAHPAQKEMGPADLNRAILATLTVARNEYKYVADLETDFGELPAVTCHVNEINQVVLNIVVNAAHAIADVVSGSERRGLIKVSTRQQGDDVVIAITDSGGGIPEAVRSRIFDPFFTTKVVGRGTGQGLAIARRTIRETHGGDVTFETTLGQGTTFFIRLPVHTSLHPSAAS